MFNIQNNPTLFVLVEQLFEYRTKELDVQTQLQQNRR
jgi:hypothetical protein